MQYKDVRPETYTKQIRCDRCGLEAALDDQEFHEFVCIDYRAGYGSVFDDGNQVQLDICQHCVKQTLGDWLRIVEPRQEGALLQSLSLFDPERHGGEFPGPGDVTLEVPEDLPVQERLPLDGEPAKRPRVLGRMKGRIVVPADFDAPLPDSARSSIERAPFLPFLVPAGSCLPRLCRPAWNGLLCVPSLMPKLPNFPKVTGRSLRKSRQILLC